MFENIHGVLNNTNNFLLAVTQEKTDITRNVVKLALLIHCRMC